MVPTIATPDLEGRKQVRLRLRPDLVFGRQMYQGRRYYVVKDPVTLRYHRFSEHDYFVLRLLDGTHTLEEARLAFERHFRPQRLELEEVEVFASELLHAGLAHNESPQAARLLLERSDKNRRSARLAAWLNVLAVRIPLFDPDRLLTRLLPFVRWAFTGWFLALSAVLVLSAVGLVLGHWNDFVARLPAAREFFALRTLFVLWAALGVVKILHEFGHGLVCKAQGGEVDEMGVLFLVFSPCLYCNASDSWMLPGKWRRIAVSAAGIYVELNIAAVATFVWWWTAPVGGLHHLCLCLMMICGVSTVVFNANPLMRFDGYYILADWLEVPNLSQRANRWLMQTVLERCLGIEVVHEEPAGTPGRRCFLGCYAVASYLYRWFVTFAILYGLHRFLQPYKLGAVSAALAGACLLGMFGWPLYRLWHTIRQRGRLPAMKAVRVGLLAALAACALGFVLFVPFPSSVEGLALIEVEPGARRRVVVPEPGGFLREVLVRDGQAVHEGDVLAILENPELDVGLRLNEADQALRRRQQRTLAVELLDRAGVPDRARRDFQETVFDLEGLATEHGKLRQERERLVLRAGCDGVVMGLRPPEEVGRWLEPDAEVCQVGDPRSLRAVLLAEPADRGVVRPGGAARLHVRGCGATSWAGMVEAIARVDAKDIPPQLSRRTGGDVAASPDPVSGAEKPTEQQYLIAVRFDEVGAAVQVGALARVKIHAPPRTLAWRLRRYVTSTFRLAE
jgi:putative peptide zinc metalloprotease protein